MALNAAFFDAGIDRRNTFCEKWDDRTVMDAGGIPLWVADMDFACAPEVEEAVRNRAEHPCFGYTCGEETEENVKALRAFWQRRHGLTVGAEETLTLPCVITGLKLCVRLLTEPGDGVAVVTPVYGPFYRSVELNGRKVVEVPLKADERMRYHMDFDALEKALENGAKLIMICSPHNPVSRLWSREELKRIADAARRFDVPVVCDEIHADFVFQPGTFTSILSLPEARDRTVMLCSASKTFNIAGLQQACAVVPNAEIRRRMQSEMDACGIVSGNTFALTATKAAYRYGDEWLDGLMNYLTENRAFLEKYAAEQLPRTRLSPIEATYLAWLDCRDYGKNTEKLMELCRENGVAFTAGTFFGTAGEGFLRINFACPRTQLEEGLNRLKAALKQAETA